MTLEDDTKAMDAALREAGANLDAVLTAAGIDRSTWTRWKNGSVKGARYDTINRVREAVDAAIRAQGDVGAANHQGQQGAAA